MDRVIEVKVGGNYLSKDSKNAGVRGEANVAYLRITFDEGWDSYTKKVTFWDSRGGNPVVRTLTIDLLENISKSKRIYLVPIPAEPMAEAGMLTYVIDGYIDGKRQRSISDQLEVKDAPIADNAGEPTDPTPTQAEQLQGQIEQIIDTIQNASVSADNAAQSEENAKASEEAAAENKAITEQLTNRAETAAEKVAKSVRELNAEAENLPEGSDASVEKIENEDGITLRFGIPKGERGPRGYKGEKGDIGPKGEAGKDGINGKDGVSTTHSWNGTVLTVTSASGTSSADLKGDKGDKGDRGEQGIQGVQGDKGEQGEKGDSYILTEADKTEIGDSVSAEIEAELNAALEEIIALQEELLIPDGNEVAY